MYVNVQKTGLGYNVPSWVEEEDGKRLGKGRRDLDFGFYILSEL
jgi:hypothetical protein